MLFFLKGEYKKKMVKSHASPDTTRFRVVVAIVAFGTLAILFASSRQGEAARGGVQERHA